MSWNRAAGSRLRVGKTIVIPAKQSARAGIQVGFPLSWNDEPKHTEYGLLGYCSSAGFQEVGCHWCEKPCSFEDVGERPPALNDRYLPKLHSNKHLLPFSHDVPRNG